MLGAPRGGTSMTVGMLRILGYRLPDPVWDPVCIHGEATRLRFVQNPDSLTYEALAARVMALPDGTVWKDPVVGEYAHLIDWSTWDVVVVTRRANRVEDSERRWMGEGYEGTGQRALKWYRNIRLALKESPPAALLRIPMSLAQRSPRQVLREMSRLSGQAPSGQQIYQTLDFIKPGYRCPLPMGCSICN